MPEITYTILKGDTELFTIDRKSGLIRTARPLDRETHARLELIVGTEENNQDGKGATTTVEVVVDVRILFVSKYYINNIYYNAYYLVIY